MHSLEEVERIREAQLEHPDTPLGHAEQFMLSLSEIDCLLERLRLWLFMLDYQWGTLALLPHKLYFGIQFFQERGEGRCRSADGVEQRDEGDRGVKDVQDRHGHAAEHRQRPELH